MTWQNVQRRWDECVVQVQQRWDRLTPGDCSSIGGDRDRLRAMLGASYPVPPFEARRQVDEFASNLRLVAPASGVGARYPGDVHVDTPDRDDQIRSIPTPASSGRPSPVQVAQARDQRTPSAPRSTGVVQDGPGTPGTSGSPARSGTSASPTGPSDPTRRGSPVDPNDPPPSPDHSEPSVGGSASSTSPVPTRGSPE